jgi:hypothetical protein
MLLLAVAAGSQMGAMNKPDWFAANHALSSQQFS